MSLATSMTKKLKINQRLQQASSAVATNKSFQEMKSLKNELGELDNWQEIMCKQRSHVDWLQAWDYNSKISHVFAFTRRCTNNIIKIQDDNQSWVEGEMGIADVAIKYLANLFTASNPSEVDDISGLIPSRLVVERQAYLVADYTEDELRHALKEMNPNKAPGPDGLTAQFYHKFWDQVSTNIVNYCLKVLNLGASV